MDDIQEYPKRGLSVVIKIKKEDYDKYLSLRLKDKNITLEEIIKRGLKKLREDSENDNNVRKRKRRGRQIHYSD